MSNLINEISVQTEMQELEMINENLSSSSSKEIVEKLESLGFYSGDTCNQCSSGDCCE